MRGTSMPASTLFASSSFMLRHPSRAVGRRHPGRDDKAVVVVMPHTVNTTEHDGGMVALYVRDVPDELHTAVKVEAAMAGESMRQLVLDALEREVARRKAERGEAGKGKRRR
jgi:hypothetical protein